MVKYRSVILIILAALFLGISFYPTIFELQRSTHLKDANREFILEHNFYWPDYNLYLSKIRQGTMGRWTALEKYTSEPHSGSLIQEFYVWLGEFGRVFGLDPNGAYQLGRIILAPLLFLIITLYALYYFRSPIWQILSVIIVYVSGSFPRIYIDDQNVTHIGRYMEWWSNIDSVQRITFIPHIMFGQVVSLFLLYSLTNTEQRITTKRILFYIILGNLTGLVFPPSLMTLLGVLIIMIGIKIFLKIKEANFQLMQTKLPMTKIKEQLIFIAGSLLSLIYFLMVTRQMPWSSLVEFHRTHPMMIPFTDYFLGTGPIFLLGLVGAFVSIVKRDRKFQPLLLWVTVTFLFAAIFSAIKEQSPLRFTQTGMFIPLGILGTYVFQQLWNLVSGIWSLPVQADQESEENDISVQTGSRLLNPESSTATTRYIAQTLTVLIIAFYVLENLYMMTVGLGWQTTWITQRIGASIPPVPYPPQSMYPLKDWMNGIRWLRDNTSPDDVVVSEITAGNHIPAYSGNTVYFGQSNTVDYERKQIEVDAFFQGHMSPNQAKLFMQNGRIKYVFFSIQEREQAQGRDLIEFYPFLREVYTNSQVKIYSSNNLN